MITFREARPEDAEQLLDHLKKIGSESNNLTFGAMGPPIDLHRQEAMLRWMAQHPRSRLLLAMDGKQIIGSSSLEGYNNPRTGHRCTFCLCVRKSHWGRGIGTALAKKQIAFARAAGVRSISLEVLADNIRAVSLYRKLGFEVIGTYRDFFFVEGRFHDAYLMNLYF